MPDRHRLQGSWVAKKTQSFVSGRPSLGEAKKAWMQLISPCRSGETRSLLDSTVMGVREDLDRMAAPKSLEPDETRVRVRGMMWDSVTERRVERRRVVGECEWVVDIVGWGKWMGRGSGMKGGLRRVEKVALDNSGFQK
jgi:hypothetical protein